MVSKKPTQAQTVTGQGNREPQLGHDIRTKIGQQLRIIYHDVVNEGIPERFAELLNRLDERESRDDKDRSSDRNARANRA
jgi:Anti-sigma factor NepR